MNTNMTGFRWFLKIFASMCFWAKVASALEGLRIGSKKHHIICKENILILHIRTMTISKTCSEFSKPYFQNDIFSERLYICWLHKAGEIKHDLYDLVIRICMLSYKYMLHLL